MARLLHVTREQILALTGKASPSTNEGTGWKVARPATTDAAVVPWFSLTPRTPSIDSRIGGTDVELTASLATFGGVTGPRLATAGLLDGADPPPVVLGGNPVAPGTPGGTAAERTRQCSLRLSLSAEGLGSERQCLVLAAVCALGQAPVRVQLVLGDRVLSEDRVDAEDRIAVLLDVPDTGALQVELWLRLASHDPTARLGVRGVQGHLL